MAATLQYIKMKTYVRGADTPHGVLSTFDEWGYIHFPIIIFDSKEECNAARSAIFNGSESDIDLFCQRFKTNTGYDFLTDIIFPGYFATPENYGGAQSTPGFPTVTTQEPYSIKRYYDPIYYTENSVTHRAYGVACSGDYFAYIWDGVDTDNIQSLSTFGGTLYNIDGTSHGSNFNGCFSFVYNNYDDHNRWQGNILFGVKGEEGKLSYALWANMYVDGRNATKISHQASYNTQTNQDSLTFLNNGNFVDEISTDPFDPGGTTGGGVGGGGTFNPGSDPVDIPGLPTLSATNAGFITLFNPSPAQLNALASYMWTNPLFDLDNWKKIFADPMEAILGLSIVPVNVSSIGSQPVKVGNIPTDISMPVVSSQYVPVDCGSISVPEFWGAYLDYDPFTKAELYLPYIGTHAIAVDDIMGKTVRVVYHVDVLSGACCAYVKCGESVLYSFIGQCAASVPIVGRDWTNVINGALNVASSIGTMVATGGASAPSALGGLASAASNIMKPNIEKSGSMSGTGGMMGIQTPYLIITRPRQAVPELQNKFTGYPSFVTKRLSDVKGYTEVESVHLEKIPATEQEYSEIVSLLKSGVIL